MESQNFVGSRGIKYLGQYKPIAPYALADDLFLLPAGSGMFPYGPGGEVRLNVSYFVAKDGRSDPHLINSFRDWLIFDAFVLADHFPIFYFDKNHIGGVELVPDEVSKLPQTPDYKQIDYSNIACISLIAEFANSRLPVLSYAHLFENYRGLSTETKDMVEWFVSAPYLSHTRPRAFFNINYWQLLHLTILLDRLVGLPPRCVHSFGACAVCGHSSQPHHSMRRKYWLRKFLTERIDSSDVVEEYARLIETGFVARNKMAHVPLFDRSSMPELVPGETQSYAVDEAIEEYEHNSAAFSSLLNSLNYVCRYLLFNQVFNTRFFIKPRPLNFTRVGGNKADSNAM